MLKTSIIGATHLYKELGATQKEQKRALNVAIKVEGFRQLRNLRDEIRAGNPGGKPYVEQLSRLARRTKTGRLKKNQIPLYRLARLVRYSVMYVDGEIKLHFGFTNSRSRKLTSSWKQLVLKHQQGLDSLYSGSRTELGIRLARIGGRLKKKGDPDARYFFLRKTTGRRIDNPERPIIEPFWEKRRQEATRNITANYRRKLRGERI